MTHRSAHRRDLPTAPVQPAIAVRPRPTGGWGGLAALTLRGQHQGGSSDALPSRLLGWARAAGASLQVRLAVRPAHERVDLALLVEVREATAPHAQDAAVRACRELTRLVGGSPGLALEPVVRQVQLAGLVRRGAQRGQVATVPPMWVPEPDMLDELVDLALHQGQPCELCITVAADPNRYDEALRATSQDLARVLSRVRGVRFLAGGQNWTHQMPADLAPLGVDAADLERRGLWMQQLNRSALQLQVAWLSPNPLDRTVLDATRRACFGDDAAWQPLTGDQAAEVRSGPLDALACPGLTPLVAPTVIGAGLLALPRNLPGQPALGPVPQPMPSSLATDRGGLLGTSGGREVRLANADLARHVWLCGQTGTGKSTVLLTLLQDLARSGQGVGLIDPHGDLADELLQRLPGRVTVFDISDPRCPGLNPLGHPDGPNRAIEEVTALIFQVDNRSHMGPVFERYSRALLTLLIAAQRPLADISKLANDDATRRQCLRRLRISDPAHRAARRFWRDEFSSWTPSYRCDMQTYVISKYDALLRSSALRRLLSPDRPQLDLERVLDGGLFVAKLSSGQVGAVSAWFAGMLLMSRLRSAVFDRVRSHRRPPFTLAVDEFHTVLQGFGYNPEERTLGSLLSEARKFGLRLVLANQHVAQLGKGTRDAVLGNVGNLLLFRLAHRDARVLTRELGDGVAPEALSGLPNFRAQARLLHHGRTLPPFHLDTVAPEGR